MHYHGTVLSHRHDDCDIFQMGGFIISKRSGKCRLIQVLRTVNTFMLPVRHYNLSTYCSSAPRHWPMYFSHCFFNISLSPQEQIAKIVIMERKKACQLFDHDLAIIVVPPEAQQTDIVRNCPTLAGSIHPNPRDNR